MNEGGEEFDWPAKIPAKGSVAEVTVLTNLAAQTICDKCGHRGLTARFTENRGRDIFLLICPACGETDVLGRKKGKQ